MMNVYPFQESDKDETIALFKKVFTDSEGKDEGTIIAKLVTELIETTIKKDIIGFIAKTEAPNKKIIGSIFFTKMYFNEDIEAYILSPLAVHSKYQRRGIGKALILAGIDCLKENGAELLFTYGDPNYYRQVGFEHITEDIIPAPQPLSMPQGWLCQSLIAKEIKPTHEKRRCVEALNHAKYW